MGQKELTADALLEKICRGEYRSSDGYSITPPLIQGTQVISYSVEWQINPVMQNQTFSPSALLALQNRA